MCVCVVCTYVGYVRLFGVYELMNVRVECLNMYVCMYVVYVMTVMRVMYASINE